MALIRNVVYLVMFCGMVSVLNTIWQLEIAFVYWNSTRVLTSIWWTVMYRFKIWVLKTIFIFSKGIHWTIYSWVECVSVQESIFMLFMHKVDIFVQKQIKGRSVLFRTSFLAPRNSDSPFSKILPSPRGSISESLILSFLPIWTNYTSK